MNRYSRDEIFAVLGWHKAKYSGQRMRDLFYDTFGRVIKVEGIRYIVSRYSYDQRYDHLQDWHKEKQVKDEQSENHDPNESTHEGSPCEDESCNNPDCSEQSCSDLSCNEQDHDVKFQYGQTHHVDSPLGNVLSDISSTSRPPFVHPRPNNRVSNPATLPPLADMDTISNNSMTTNNNNSLLYPLFDGPPTKPKTMPSRNNDYTNNKENIPPPSNLPMCNTGGYMSANMLQSMQALGYMPPTSYGYLPLSAYMGRLAYQQHPSYMHGGFHGPVPFPHPATMGMHPSSLPLQNSSATSMNMGIPRQPATPGLDILSQAAAMSDYMSAASQEAAARPSNSTSGLTRSRVFSTDFASEYKPTFTPRRATSMSVAMTDTMLNEARDLPDSRSIMTGTTDNKGYGGDETSKSDSSNLSSFCEIEMCKDEAAPYAEDQEEDVRDDDHDVAMDE